MKKPFLLAGVVTFTILLVLAATSFNAAVRWLGGRNWKNLHRLVYVAACLAPNHQAPPPKIYPVQVLWIFVPVAVLELARILRQAQKKASPVRAAPQSP
jgi:sulfoxide reductase heme-binding subunit YedZ